MEKQKEKEENKVCINQRGEQDQGVINQRARSPPLPFFFPCFFVFLFLSPKLHISPMGRTSIRWPIIWLNRVVPRVRLRSPLVEPKRISNAKKTDRITGITNGEKHCNNIEWKPGIALGRRIMIVVDSSAEAKAALQWALSHTVQNHDTMVLLSVIKPCGQGGCSSLFFHLNRTWISMFMNN